MTQSSVKQSELDRSASEARKIVIKPVETERYMNPMEGTPYPLEYAFYLLGNVHEKLVLDLGCGSGESVIPLLRRGARVIGIDISPELIEIAKKRLEIHGLQGDMRVGSAYETQLPAASVDVVFCMSLIHHLDIKRMRDEMLRILRPGGILILKEPIRFSREYGLARSLFPSQDDISDDEHPLTREELQLVQQGFESDGLRFFRLPLVPLAQRLAPAMTNAAFILSSKVITAFPAMSRYATSAVVRLRKAN